MDGTTQKAGAVGGVMTVKNPIRLARAVMEKSPHVLSTGRGAEQFAVENSIETVGPAWFFTPGALEYACRKCWPKKIKENRRRVAVSRL